MTMILNDASPLMKPDACTAILFDWDNTLVDSWDLIFHTFNKTLAQFGLKPWEESFAQKNMQHSGREAFPKLFGSAADDAQAFFYKLFEENHLSALKPLPEVADLLDHLREKKIPMGIVSNKRGAVLRKEVSHLGWQNYFGSIVGAGDAKQDKPAADPALLALKGLNIPPSLDVWFVGDAPVDWACAMAAGCRSIAVGQGFDIPSSVFVSIENSGALKKIFAHA
jgi:phosphoglycolate phosphatase